MQNAVNIAPLLRMNMNNNRQLWEIFPKIGKIGISGIRIFNHNERIIAKLFDDENNN